MSASSRTPMPSHLGISTHPPVLCTFELPEIFDLICSFVEKTDLVMLSTVSRKFFYGAAPLIWKEVLGVEKLLDLLPRSDVNELMQVEPKHPQPCNHDELARFAIYAPFVQKLESNTETETGSLGWELLISRVPARPLLPNLRALAIISQRRGERNYRIIEYVDAFLCPTLSSIYVTRGYNTWMNSFKARDLLVRMTAICPGLTKLSILPGNSRLLDSSSLLSPHSPASLFAPINQFRDLCAFHSGSAILNFDVLQLLGDLPCLESLGAYSPSTDYEVDDDIQVANLVLPDHSFPALRHLEINCVPVTVMSKLWQTPPLVRNLKSVKIQLLNDDSEVLSRLICIICQGSPGMTEVDLDLVEVEWLELSSEAIEHLRQLPLLRVRIREYQSDDVQPLILALPKVEYLDIADVNIEFDDLALIAQQMPRLQYLHVWLSLRGWPDEPGLPRDKSSPSPCHIDSSSTFEQGIETEVDDPDSDEAIKNIARGLHALWPRGVRCGFGGSYIDNRRENNTLALERLNEMIRALSDTLVLDVPTAEESASRWLYDSW
ncbi:hypothetical protein BDV93DRAFT_547202 [Ceratobasidium sp. AG-I]|nr:hypothetical protein BDV93DRAFT_547202 [Ceratobasidium sp. AG-I]